MSYCFIDISDIYSQPAFTFKPSFTWNNIGIKRISIGSCYQETVVNEIFVREKKVDENRNSFFIFVLTETVIIFGNILYGNYGAF